MTRRIWILVVFFAVACGLAARTSAQEAEEDPLANETNLKAAVHAYRNSVFIVGDEKVGHGTAFLISRKHRLLATNAHVADMFYQTEMMYAVRNGGSDRYEVEKVYIHPLVLRNRGLLPPVHSDLPENGEVNPVSADVALLQLKPGLDLPTEFPLATRAEIGDLVGDTVGVLGFPAHDTDGFPKQGLSVNATFHTGTVSRLWSFSGQVTSKASENQYLQYTASGPAGFSGSPVFLPNGHVVALHNSARTVGEDRLNHGIRVDALWELLVHAGFGQDFVNDIDAAQFAEKVKKVERIWDHVVFSKEQDRFEVWLTFDRDGVTEKGITHTWGHRMSVCETAVKKFPNLPFAHFQRGRVLLELLERETRKPARKAIAQEALASLRRALSIDKDEIDYAIEEIRATIISGYEDNGTYANENAKDRAEKLPADDMSPSQKSLAIMWFAVARSRSKPEELLTAINLLDQAIELDPRNHEARRWQAIFLRQAGHPNLAEQRESEVQNAARELTEFKAAEVHVLSGMIYHDLRLKHKQWGPNFSLGDQSRRMESLMRGMDTSFLHIGDLAKLEPRTYIDYSSPTGPKTITTFNGVDGEDTLVPWETHARGEVREFAEAWLMLNRSCTAKLPSWKALHLFASVSARQGNLDLAIEIEKKALGLQIDTTQQLLSQRCVVKFYERKRSESSDLGRFDEAFLTPGRISHQCRDVKALLKRFDDLCIQTPR